MSETGRKRFRYGDRVKPSRYGRTKFGLFTDKHRAGTVVNKTTRGMGTKVLWDHQKTPKGYADIFLTKIRGPKP